MSHGIPRDYLSAQNIYYTLCEKIVKTISPQLQRGLSFELKGNLFKFLSSLLFYTLIYCFTWEIIHDEVKSIIFNVEEFSLSTVSYFTKLRKYLSFLFIFILVYFSAMLLDIRVFSPTPWSTILWLIIFKIIVAKLMFQNN